MSLTKLGIKVTCDERECGSKTTIGAEKDLGGLGWIVMARNDVKYAFCSLAHERKWIDEKLAQSELPLGDGAAPDEPVDESEVTCYTIRATEADAPDERYCELHLLAKSGYRYKHQLADDVEIEIIEHAEGLAASCDEPSCRWHVEPEAEGDDQDDEPGNYGEPTLSEAELEEATV